LRFNLWILISEDPRTSARPAEGIRVAAGIAALRTVRVTVCLRGAAVSLLGSSEDDWIDAEVLGRYLPGIKDSELPIYVSSAARALAGLEASPQRYREISEGELAHRLAQSNGVLRF
jgi:hypothetical protein